MTRLTPLSDVAPAAGDAIALPESPPQAHINLRGNAGDGRFTAAVHAVVGLTPPTRPNTLARGPDRMLAWLGPDEWLLQAPDAQRAALLEGLRGALASLHAAVTDTSDAFSVLTLDHPLACDILARGCPLDLDPAVFPPGTCAHSVFHKSGLLLVREGPQRFVITVRRSFARYLYHALQDAAGLALAR